MAEKLADSVAALSLEHYEKLPSSAKPAAQGEWTLLAVIVMECGLQKSVVSLGTGSKCIGAAMMSSHGDILNDSHAEVMARRGLLRYLYDQVRCAHTSGSSDVFSGVNSDMKCVLRDDVKFHLFISHTPCGDASIIPKFDSGVGKRKCDSEGESKQKILKIDEDSDENITKVPSAGCEPLDVHRTGAKCVPGSSVQDPRLPGTAYHLTLAVRTKPGRGDPTLSLSCSDKLARWCAVGLQGALLSMLMDRPVYLHSIVVAAGCPYSEQAMHRAIVSRVLNAPNLPPPFSIHAPLLLQSSLPFPHGEKAGGRPCPASMVWSAQSKCKFVPNDKRNVEVAVKGKRQGIANKNTNTPAARLKICKLLLFSEFVEIVKMLASTDKQIPEMKDVSDVSVLIYKNAKLKATLYQQAWQSVKIQCFPEWPMKPQQFLQFTVDK